MSEKKGNWEKLIHLPEEYETNPELVKNAIAIVEQRKQAKKQGWFSAHWKRFSLVVAACAVTAAIAVPVTLSLLPPEIVYYDATQIVVDTDLDADAFVAEHGLDICYFSGETVKTQCAKVLDNQELAFLNQNFFDLTSFDNIDLKVVLLANAEFEFFDSFDLLELETTVADTVIAYKVNEVAGNVKKTIKAKFTYEKVDYYMELTTSEKAEERLAYYINMLIE